jgi:hypothetical protein
MNQEQLEDMMAILKKEFKDAFDKAGADKKDV